MKKLLAILFVVFSFASAEATHLVGGSLSYQRLGVNSQGQVEYRIRLALYRDCTSDIKFDNRIKLGVHQNNSSNSLYRRYDIRIDQERRVDPLDNANCSFKPNVCLMEGIYEEVIALPQSSFGYHLTYIRCCRNNLNNVPDGPNGEPDQGQTYYAFIPPTPVVNSSPRFSGVPVPFICVNDTASMFNTAVDPDGDSLVYRFTTPFQGGDLSRGNSSANPDPAPFLDLPIEEVTYNAGYNTNFPFGAGGYQYINPNNGLTELMSREVGVFAIAVEVLEFRKGISQPLSTTRLELQIIVIQCPPNKRPQFTAGTNNGTFYYEVEEGQELCFDITGSDADGDEVELLRIGDIFTGSDAATLTQRTGKPSVTSQFCWTPACGRGRDEPYTFLVGLHDDGCPKKVNNETFTIKVNKFIGATEIIGDISPCEFSKSNTYRINGSLGSSFDWEVTGGTITSGQGTDEITVDWNQDPSAEIRVTEISRYGCRGSTAVVSIDLRQAPSLPLLSGDNIVCQNTSSSYSTPAIPGITFTWFVEGGVINGSNTGNTVSVNWGLKGPGRVALIATNGDGCNSDTAVRLIEIRHPEPEIDGSFSVCPNSRFVDYSTEFNQGSTYQWTISGGTQSGGGNSNAIKVDWGNATIGYVEVIETDRYGCVSDPYRQAIEVEYNLELLFREEPEDSVCEFTTHTYTVQYTNGSTYHWTVDGGAKTSEDSLHKLDITWLDAGIGKFSVYESAWDPIAQRECRSQLIERDVVINPIPEANTILGETEVCQSGDEYTYTLEGFENSTYQWMINGSETRFIRDGQGTNTITVIWDRPGAWTLSVFETTEHGCTNEIIDTIVIVNPKPTTTPIGGDDVVCYPNTGNFTYAVTGFVGSTYNWTVNGGNITSNPANTDKIDVTWNDSWSENQSNFVQVVEVSDKNCAGDTLSFPVWYDKPFIDMRYISVGNTDDKMEVVWQLIDAPRYDNVVEVNRTVYQKSAWAQVGAIGGTSDFYEDDGLNTDVNRYTYYVRGYNLCGDSIISEQHTNVQIQGEKVGPYEVEMGFTPYMGWDNGVSKYELYTKLTNRTDYELVRQVNLDETIYIGEGLEHFEQCFRIKATENGGNQEESWSNEICFTFDPILYVPSAFTPNGDGLNEIFEIVHRAIKEYRITIYNRWGEKLFYSEDIFSPWDGTYRGTLVQQGVYLYTIYYRGYDNHLKVETGTVTVIR